MERTSDQWSRIPERTIKALKRWEQYGVEPGQFLTAVLCNDLVGAVNRADDDNAPVLRLIVLYVYNELPGNCWGSYQIMQDWRDKHEDKLIGLSA
jgi:hypothetical protein